VYVHFTINHDNIVPLPLGIIVLYVQKFKIYKNHSEPIENLDSYIYNVNKDKENSIIEFLVIYNLMMTPEVDTYSCF
jgi:hypothetical protein